MSNDRIVSTKDIEGLLICLPGIQKARVVVDDWGAIKEIHILTGLDRSPKQIVRDVESALKAQWNITLDRRKVSVAQVRTRIPPSDDRLRFVSLEVKTDAKKGTSEVCVSLERNHEDEIVSYTGRSEGDISPRSVLYGIARATCLAANLAIPPSSEIFIDDVQMCIRDSLVYGPSTIQEACDLMGKAFEVAEKYRNPVMILGDGMMGQMMEPVVFPEELEASSISAKPWATTGKKGRPANLITSIYLDPEVLDTHNWKLYEKYSLMQEHEVMYETKYADDAEWFLVAYGTIARICTAVVEKLRKEGVKIGLIRPITLWPFPFEAFDQVAEHAKGCLLYTSRCV